MHDYAPRAARCQLGSQVKTLPDLRLACIGEVSAVIGNFVSVNSLEILFAPVYCVHKHLELPCNGLGLR